METFLSRYKNSLVLGLVLVAQFFLLAVQVRRPLPAAAARVDQDGVRALRFGMTSVVTPPESVLHRGGLSVRDVWSSYLDLIGVREENARLKEELDQLHLEQAALAEDARQGQRLQDLLAFRQHYINTTVPAQVVGTSGTDRSRVIYLDKGSDDGIAPDQPVITPDGIVGRVREVYAHTAQVLQISDPTSAAGVLLEETRTRGILRGNAQGQPQIVNLMPDDRIKPGQVVLTSGGDQIFPRGLPVGVVDHISPDKDNEPMVDVVLKPAANLSRLEEVLVITGTGPAPTDRARHDLSKSELMAAGVRAAREAKAQQDADDSQRASDVLAQRLPSRYDQADFYAPDATADASPATSEAEAKPLHPPAPLHPDHYSPTDVPAAQNLTPGQRYAPLIEGSAATERRGAKGAGADNVNATDNAPVEANPAFAAASAAVAARHKALEDAKNAEAARSYAALHPAEAAAAKAAGSGDAAAGSPAAPAVRYTERLNADGTIARVALPPGSTAPAVHYVNRTNADGTVTKVAVPVAAPAVAGAASGVRYTERLNADGTIARVALPPGSTAPAVHYVNRTNADGTVTKVAVPVAALAVAGAASGVRYTERLNADGTIARVALPPGSTAPAVHYVNRTNADGTVTKVAVPTGMPGAAAASTNRTNADGTVARVPAPQVAPGQPRTPGAGPAATRPGSAAQTAPAARPQAAPAAGPVQTRVITDGPITPGSQPGSKSGSQAAAPRAGRAPAATGQAPAASSAAPRRKGPEIVPDDGSKPPVHAATPPQGNL